MRPSLGHSSITSGVTRIVNILPSYPQYSTNQLRTKSPLLKRRLTTTVNAAPEAVEHDEIPIEVRYTRKNPVEHILLRPGMYVGPTERLSPSPTWVLDTHASSSTQPQLQIIRKTISNIPALLKIFDEILVNASDNALRKSQYPTTRIDVVIHTHGGTHSINKSPSDDIPVECRNHPYISISNNGCGIPVSIHRHEGVYVPELLFGHLLTGSNFDDGDSITTSAESNRLNKRITGGRHGYGAKLTNIFSKWFKVETLDVGRGKRYRQVWENNMSIKHEPIIDDMESSHHGTHKTDQSSLDDVDSGYTTVSFVPDMKQLWRNYAHSEAIHESSAEANHTIPEEDYAIMCKRVYDIAACSGGNVTVSLNGNVIPIQSFKDYVHLYRSGSTSPPVIFDEINSNWEIGVGLSRSGSFEHISFVNGMATTRGGSHIDVIVQQITSHITQRVSKMHPELAFSLSPSLVKRSLAVFVNAFVENPSFDSQMKESLTSNPDSFGSSYKLSDSFLEDLVKEEASFDPNNENEASSKDGGPGIVEELVRVARGRLQSSFLKELNKRPRRSTLSIPKLDDAHMAGTDQGHKCTLILTEGDSAKAFCIAGLETMGRDLFGVFPLKGKFLNVRDASANQLSSNAEVKALYAILGLEFDLKYETTRERSKLRYGHVMLMTDQDTDGTHIKGLIMNFFRHFWPSLLKPAVDDVRGKPFLSSFVTPLLKARSGKRDVLHFFSLSDYNDWRVALSQDGLKKWTIKYYKGLGTNTHAEAKEYFGDYAKHHRLFRWESEDDGHLIDMVFDKGRSDDRKEWINNCHRAPLITSSNSSTENLDNSITFQNFINTEMIQFSNADNVRSLPSVVDGLKPSQRKVLYACFKRKLKHEMKVAQLSGYCAEHTSYHHGEAALHATSKLHVVTDSSNIQPSSHLFSILI